MPRPVCFIVMPFGTKKTDSKEGDAPVEVDFDALWERAIRPALIDLGYAPVRADQEVGPLILLDMLERLALSDLVVADISIANGNVYYEVGVRHAIPKRFHCVLVAASWARPLFDLGQVRHVSYPFPKTQPGAADYAEVQRVLVKEIPKHAEARSPVHTGVQGYPEPDPKHAQSFQDLMSQLHAFQAQVSALRAAPQEERKLRTEELVKLYGPSPGKPHPMLPPVATELLYLVRDWLGWPRLIEYVEALPSNLRALPLVQEQFQLARSKTGSHLEAIGALGELVEQHGDSSERQGLLGGRYKKLLEEAKKTGKSADVRRYLGKAIEHYERGMYLDLNDYYPSSNLARLYRERKAAGDEERATAVAHVVVHACERARRRGASDPWLRSTLLGSAFDAGDPVKACELVDQIEEEGSAAWMLEATIPDLERSAAQVTDEAVRAELQQSIARLRALV